MGVEFNVADVELAFPLQLGTVNQFQSKTSQHDSPIAFQDMATVPLLWLENALPRLTRQEQDMMLRHKVVAYTWLPQCTIYGVATEHGLH